jgi:Raf kinase inhibitor-like YbhB/YbcL family protein
MAFEITSNAFRSGSSVPKKFTCDGPDVSPALSWTGAPAKTKSFALIVDDPDAPVGTWVHWVLYNLPSDTRNVAEGTPKDPRLPNGALQGRNDFGKVGYNGPCPPRGSAHRYFFKIYALDSQMGLKPGATKADLERAMKGHTLDQAQLIGTFQH